MSILPILLAAGVMVFVNEVKGNCGTQTCSRRQVCTIGYPQCAWFCAEGTTCPKGVQTVACFADPCAVTKCDNHPDAFCVSNYCGGCNAFFYDCKDGHQINDCTNGAVA